MVLSNLSKTWIIDLDGVIFYHNGYKKGGDKFLPGALEFLKSIPKSDKILILTAREENEANNAKKILEKEGIDIYALISSLGAGERILINDRKPSGLKTAYACNIKRDKFDIKFKIDRNL